MLVGCVCRAEHLLLNQLTFFLPPFLFFFFSNSECLRIKWLVPSLATSSAGRDQGRFAMEIKNPSSYIVIYNFLFTITQQWTPTRLELFRFEISFRNVNSAKRNCIETILYIFLSCRNSNNQMLAVLPCGWLSSFSQLVKLRNIKDCKLALRFLFSWK